MSKTVVAVIAGVVGAVCGAVAAFVIGLAIYFLVRDADSTLPTQSVGIDGTVVSTPATSASVTCVDAVSLPRDVTHVKLADPVCAEGATAAVGSVVSGDLLLVEVDAGSGYREIWASLRGDVSGP